MTGGRIVWVRPGIDPHPSMLCTRCWRADARHGKATCKACALGNDQHFIPCRCHYTPAGRAA